MIRTCFPRIFPGSPLLASEVMALALYHPEFGYYRRAIDPWGFEDKDYYTALDLGPCWGKPWPCDWSGSGSDWIGPGFHGAGARGGAGWLGRDLLQAATGAFAEALVYVHRDDNPAARVSAEEALGPWLGSGKARMVRENDRIAPFQGAILSNELFDALPAQPWRWTGEVWEREILRAEGPDWEVADPGAAGAWFEAQAEDGLQAGDGSIWCEGMSSSWTGSAIPSRQASSSPSTTAKPRRASFPKEPICAATGATPWMVAGGGPGSGGSYRRCGLHAFGGPAADPGASGGEPHQPEPMDPDPRSSGRVGGRLANHGSDGPGQAHGKPPATDPAWDDGRAVSGVGGPR